MLIAVARESDPAEPRVAGTPETVKKFKSLGAEVVVARGAGVASGILDADYEAAGAKLGGDDVTKDADVVLSGNVGGLSAEELAALPEVERGRLRERAAVELGDADVLIDSIAELPGAVAAIEGRMAKGQRPKVAVG